MKAERLVKVNHLEQDGYAYVGEPGYRVMVVEAMHYKKAKLPDGLVRVCKPDMRVVFDGEGYREVARGWRGLVMGLHQAVRMPYLDFGRRAEVLGGGVDTGVSPVLVGEVYRFNQCQRWWGEIGKRLGSDLVVVQRLERTVIVELPDEAGGGGGGRDKNRLFWRPGDEGVAVPVTY